MPERERPNDDEGFEELAADAADEETVMREADRYAEATRDAEERLSERVESAAPDELRVNPESAPRDLRVREGEQHQPQLEDPDERRDPTLRNEEDWLTAGYSKEDLDLDESEERIDPP